MEALPNHKNKCWLGEKIGSYTVIGVGSTVKYPSQTHPVQKWKVKCECGVEKEISKWHIVYQKVSGCEKCKGDRARFVESPNWTSDAKNVTGMYYQKIKKCAEKRGILFDVTREQLDEVFQQQDKKCKYLGIDLYFETSKKRGTASLDRIDSKKGYTVDNIQWVHKDLNTIKWDLSHEQFVNICKTIAKRF